MKRTYVLIMLMALFVFGMVPVAQAKIPHYSQSYSKARIKKAAKVMKANSKTEIADLFWLCKRESNFHNWSHSHSGCHGLFQLSSGMAHGHKWWDPYWNTKRAIKYMKGRYGSIHKAKLFWLRHHWY